MLASSSTTRKKKKNRVWLQFILQLLISSNTGECRKIAKQSSTSAPSSTIFCSISHLLTRLMADSASLASENGDKITLINVIIIAIKEWSIWEETGGHAVPPQCKAGFGTSAGDRTSAHTSCCRLPFVDYFYPVELDRTSDAYALQKLIHRMMVHSSACL